MISSCQGFFYLHRLSHLVIVSFAFQNLFNVMFFRLSIPDIISYAFWSLCRMLLPISCIFLQDFSNYQIFKVIDPFWLDFYAAWELWIYFISFFNMRKYSFYSSICKNTLHNRFYFLSKIMWLLTSIYLYFLFLYSVVIQICFCGHNMVFESITLKYMWDLVWFLPC